MILGWLLVTFVSAILFALLIPPIKVEDARPLDFEDDGFPKASENAPIPYLIGKDQLSSPNTLFAGGFRTQAITTRVKVSLFKKKTVIQGYKYYLTLDLGICLGGEEGVTLHKILIDDKTVWEGTKTDSDPFTIVDSELFGGHLQGGGFSATCRFYPGTFDQPKDSYIDGLEASNGLLTKYKGIAHIVFQDAYIGESPQLRKIGFVVSRFTNRLELEDGHHIIGETTVNVAEAIYSAMVDDWGGLGINPLLIDDDVFRDVAEVLFEEGQGAAGALHQQKDGKGFISEFTRQIDGIMTINPMTNKIILKLLRLDYDPDALPFYGPGEILSVDNFSQTLWNELISQVKVSFKDETSEYKDTTASDQDLAVASMTGRLKTTAYSMPFVRKQTLAQLIAGRELNQLSRPATVMTLSGNRSAGSLLPGKVFRFRWPDYGIASMILRVKDIDGGTDNDGTVKLEVIRDAYGEQFTTFAPPVTGPDGILTTRPLPVEDYAVWDIPEYIYNQNPDLEDLDIFGSTSVSHLMLLPIPANEVSIQVSALQGVEDFAYEDLLFPDHGFLQTAIADTDGYALGNIASVVILGATSIPEEWVNGDASTVRAGANLIYISGEAFAFEDFSVVDDTVTITNVHRALLNTRAMNHAAGDAVFFVNDLSYVSLTQTNEADSPVDVTFIPSSGPTTLDPEFITPFEVPAVGAISRPDPPHYIQIEGSRNFPTLDPEVEVDLTWRSRNSKKGTVQLVDDVADVLDEDDDYEYEISVINESNVEVFNDLVPYTVAGEGVAYVYETPAILASEEFEIRIYLLKAGRRSVTYDWIRFYLTPADALLIEGDEDGFLLLEGDAGSDHLSLEGDMSD